ncbi:hypothetical protein [Clostridium beijerinckii]|uniref:hypothetical protein n=1 Tax=Clostridium beijerinckii TaxID=1520 RepID=UPI00054EC0DA|nr:hypothetical protein [Clostridium beijerinckii]
MNKSKQIQIPEELFAALLRYFNGGNDENTAKFIKDGLNAKIDAIIAREYYSEYKTAPSPQKREEARQDYLNHKGIRQNFRW